VTAEPSEARFRAWALGLLALVGPPLLFFAYYKLMFPGLTNPDAMDFAQLARNLASGQGFVTHILRPLALSPAYGANPLHQPDVTHGPLYPFLLAIAFGALGAKDSVAAMVSGGFYLLTIPVLYQLGKRAFNRNIGLVTTLIFIFNALMLEYAASGLHITLYIFLATSLFLTIFNVATWERSGYSANRLPRLQLFLAGALTGLLYLTDPIFFWVIPAVVGSMIWVCRTRRLPSLLWFSAPLAVLCLPWMVRNGIVTGNPLFGLHGEEILMNTKLYPGYLAYRMTPGDITPGMGLFQSVVRKILLSAGQVIQAFPQVTASWVLAFFLPSLFFRFRNPASNQVRTVVMYCFLGIFVGCLLFTLQMPLFVATIPTMLIFAVAYMIYLIQQAQMSRGSLVWVGALVVVAVVYPLATQIFLQDKTPRLKEAGPARLLAQFVQKDEIVLSDEPWIAAWYADRPSLWIPTKTERVEDFKKRFAGKMRGLLLTERSQGLSQEWQAVYTVFRQANQAYAAWDQTQKAQQAANPPGTKEKPATNPPVAMINKERLPEAWGASFKQLFSDLDGFISLPTDPSTMATVVAAAPSGQATHTNSGQAK
jgi:4-amino-4-deoxy-L-arabinose transferase-like glycosyltransferase